MYEWSCVLCCVGGFSTCRIEIHGLIIIYVCTLVIDNLLSGVSCGVLYCPGNCTPGPSFHPL